MDNENNQTNGNNEPTERPQTPEEQEIHERPKPPEESEAPEMPETTEMSKTKGANGKEVKTKQYTFKEFVFRLRFLFDSVLVVLAVCAFILSLLGHIRSKKADDRSKEAHSISKRANERAEALFVEKNRPYISVEPVWIFANPSNNQHSISKFNYGNYTGFDACDVTLDVRYGPETNLYIEEYIRLENGDFVPYKGKKSKNLISRESKVKYFIGSLPLKNKFESLKKNNKYSYPIFAEVTWKNTDGRKEKVIYEYRLIQHIVGEKEYYKIEFKSKTTSN